MAEQMPTLARLPSQPDNPEQRSGPGPNTLELKVYNSRRIEVDVTAETQPELTHSLISEGCLQRLGMIAEPTSKDVFLNIIGGHPVDPIGTVLLSAYTEWNSKTFIVSLFVVVRGLAADMILGKADCKNAAIRRRKELYPIFASKMTEEEKQVYEARKREAGEKARRKAAEQREAKRQKNDAIRRGEPAKGSDGSK